MHTFKTNYKKNNTYNQVFIMHTKNYFENKKNVKKNE